MEENKKPTVALNDLERFPLINDLSFLMKMRQDEFAPDFNFQSGDRLVENQLEQVRHYAKNIRGNQTFWEKGTEPGWLTDYLSWCFQTVPYYKNRAKSFNDQPTINRGIIRSIPWEFVSSESNLDDLLIYQTSGTTGAAMDVIFDPVSQACWLPQLQSILDKFHISIDSNPDIVAIALICSQSSTLTYASLSTFLNGAGVLKINLNTDHWKEPSHSIQYLEKYNPQILTGDPFAFIDLLNLKPKITPKALVSSAMKLTDGARKKLEEYFLCPVIDIYSLTECRMIAFGDGKRHRAIRPELFLEVFDIEKDIALPNGERGELVVTGGNNPFLPLVRYRTGDFCKLEIENGIPYLVDLEARAPVAFYTRNGRFINNIDISRRLTGFPLTGFSLHQSVDYRVTFTGWCSEDIASEIRDALMQLFDDTIPLQITILPIPHSAGVKPVTYSSDMILES